MMATAAQALRRWRLGRHQARSAVEGPPPGLPGEVLAAACQDATGRPPRRIAHLHRSPFKTDGGSYLVLVEVGRGRRWSCFFKDARYEHLLPALDGFPATPGPGELAVYRARSHALSRRLPAVLWAEETTPGARFRFLLGDARPGRAKPRTPTEAARVAGDLPALSAALAGAVDPGALVTYDRAFFEQLAAFAEQTVASLRQRHPERSTLGEVLEAWPRLARHLTDRAFVEAVPAIPVHGDLNTASVLVSRRTGEPPVYLDWEWAGIGPAHLDLAMLVEGADPPTEAAVLDAYARAEGAVPAPDHRRLLGWAKVATSVTNAAVFAAQDLAGHPQPRRSRTDFVDLSLTQAMAALPPG